MKTTYEPGAGIHISAACQEAVAFAKQHGESQTFTFNDITITATPETDPAALSAEFSAKQEANHKAWQDSPEGRQHAENRRLEICRKQAQHDTLVNDLPRVLMERRDALMRWLAMFAEAADDVGVVRKLPVVIAALEGAGYSSNDALGLDKREYDKPAIMCAYIVGQALSCMKNGMPPHPMTGSFVERYFASVSRLDAARGKRER